MKNLSFILFLAFLIFLSCFMAYKQYEPFVEGMGTKPNGATVTNAQDCQSKYAVNKNGKLVCATNPNGYSSAPSIYSSTQSSEK